MTIISVPEQLVFICFSLSKKSPAVKISTNDASHNTVNGGYLNNSIYFYTFNFVFCIAVTG